jgi:hypothetical protein
MGQGRHVQDKRIDYWWGSLPLTTPFLLKGWWDMPFIVVLFPRPWGRIWSSFAHTISVIRADEPWLICVFLLDLIPVEESALPIDSRWKEDTPLVLRRPISNAVLRLVLHVEHSPWKSPTFLGSHFFSGRNSSFVKASCSVYVPMELEGAWPLVSVVRYTMHCVACKV